MSENNERPILAPAFTPIVHDPSPSAQPQEIPSDIPIDDLLLSNAQVDNDTEISFRAISLNPEDPESIHHMVTKFVSDRIKEIPSTYLRLDQTELKKLVKPSETIEAIRTSFWIEYNAAILGGYKKMTMDRVFAGLCYREYFYDVILRTPLLLLWILTPPIEYYAMLKNLLRATLSRMFELVNFPMRDEEGKVDHKTAALILKTHEMVEYRLKGTPIQRTETKSLNVSVAATPGQVRNLKIDLIEKSLEAKVKELQEKERRLIGKYTKTLGEEIDSCQGENREGTSSSEQGS